MLVQIIFRFEQSSYCHFTAMQIDSCHGLDKLYWGQWQGGKTPLYWWYEEVILLISTNLLLMDQPAMEFLCCALFVKSSINHKNHVHHQGSCLELSSQHRLFWIEPGHDLYNRSINPNSPSHTFMSPSDEHWKRRLPLVFQIFSHISLSHIAKW